MGKTTEIELKAHVDNSARCREKLTILAGAGTPFSKDDAYWFPPGSPDAALPGRVPKGAVQGAVEPGLPASGLRVRREEAGQSGETQHTWVTWKDKERRNGFEVNEEHEFEVTSGADFEELLARLGLEKRIHKRKQGWSWQYQGITAELCEVSGKHRKPEESENMSGPGNPEGSGNSEEPKNIGWFLELEILAEDDSAQTIRSARERLFSLLEQAGIGKENIENRYYSEMLEH